MTRTTDTPALPPSLGGQAVIEGVMIRGSRGMAVCVRKPDGELACRTELNTESGPLRHIPLARGISALGEQLGQGMRAMVWSAQIAAGKEPEEPEPGDVRTSAAISLGLAASVFLLAPAVASRRLEGKVARPRVAALVEGVFRMGMLVSYLRVLGAVPQARRLFGYHGAEHRAIQAYEAGQPLEVESLHQFPNAHIRCGTSFLLTTMVISSVLYAAIGPQPMGKRLLTRALLTPVIAGMSYEAIRLASSSNTGIFRALFRPNMALQSLTTRDPDEPQMEVALAAVRAALALHQSA